MSRVSGRSHSILYRKSAQDLAQNYRWVPGECQVEKQASWMWVGCGLLQKWSDHRRQNAGSSVHMFPRKKSDPIIHLSNYQYLSIF